MNSDLAVLTQQSRPNHVGQHTPNSRNQVWDIKGSVGIEDKQISGGQQLPPAPKFTELAGVDISHAPQEAPPAKEVNQRRAKEPTNNPTLDFCGIMHFLNATLGTPPNHTNVP